MVLIVLMFFVVFLGGNHYNKTSNCILNFLWDHLSRNEHQTALNISGLAGQIEFLLLFGNARTLGGNLKAYCPLFCALALALMGLFGLRNPTLVSRFTIFLNATTRLMDLLLPRHFRAFSDVRSM